MVRLKKREHEGFGFSVRGDSPVIVAGIDPNSIAEVGNLNSGLICNHQSSILKFRLAPTFLIKKSRLILSAKDIRFSRTLAFKIIHFLRKSNNFFGVEQNKNTYL